MARERIVFIIGNGFSIGMNFPTFSELYDICKKPVDKYTPLLLNDFDEFPFSYFDKQGIKNIELLLSVWEAYIRSYEDIMPDKSPLKSTYAYIVDYLKTMCGHLVNYSTAAMETSLFKEFTQLIRMIMEERDISFITLNYDLILERIAEKLNTKVNYLSNPTSKSLTVRKLHGSVNWVESSGVIVNRDGYRYPVIWEDSDKYSTFKTSCIDDSYDWPLPYPSFAGPPVIITPTVSKQYKGIFRRILALAEDELDAADKVIIVGYSFPEFDLLPLDIIKNAFTRNKNKWKLFVCINRNIEDSNKIFHLFDKKIKIINETWSADLLSEILK